MVLSAMILSFRILIKNYLNQQIKEFLQLLALKQGYSVDRIHELTKISKWFLYKMKNIVDAEKILAGKSLKEIDYELKIKAKRIF